MGWPAAGCGGGSGGRIRVWVGSGGGVGEKASSGGRRHQPSPPSAQVRLTPDTSGRPDYTQRPIFGLSVLNLEMTVFDFWIAGRDVRSCLTWQALLRSNTAPVLCYRILKAAANALCGNCLDAHSVPISDTSTVHVGHCRSEHLRIIMIIIIIIIIIMYFSNIHLRNASWLFSLQSNECVNASCTAQFTFNHIFIQLKIQLNRYIHTYIT